MATSGKRSAQGTKKGRAQKRKVGAKKKYKVHHVVEKVGKLRYSKGEYRVGALTISQAKHQAEQKLAWELLAKDSAKNSKERNAAAKKVKALKALNKKLDNI